MATNKQLTIHANNKHLNILILCANNKTAKLKPTKLHNHIAYIVDNYFKTESPVTQNIYYMGMDLTHDLENKKCESTADDLIINCEYKHNMFDIILSEFCQITVYTTKFFNNITNLLNKNGVYSCPKPKDTDIHFAGFIMKYTTKEFFNTIKEQHSLIHIENYNAKHITSDGAFATQTWPIIKKENAPAVIDDRLNKINPLNMEHGPVDTGMPPQMQPNLINFISLGK